MAADEAVFNHGKYTAGDYTATADILGGEVVVLNTTAGNLGTGIAHHAIANGTIGALGIDGGVYAVKNISNAANWVKVFWDDTNNGVSTTSTSNGLFGYIVRGGGGGVNTTAYALHIAATG